MPTDANARINGAGAGNNVGYDSRNYADTDSRNHTDNRNNAIADGSDYAGANKQRCRFRNPGHDSL